MKRSPIPMGCGLFGSILVFAFLNLLGPRMRAYGRSKSGVDRRSG